MIAAPGTYSIGFVLAIKLPNGRIKFNFSLLLRPIINEFHASVAKNTSLDRLDAIVPYCKSYKLVYNIEVFVLGAWIQSYAVLYSRVIRILSINKGYEIIWAYNESDA